MFFSWDLRVTFAPPLTTELVNFSTLRVIKFKLHISQTVQPLLSFKTDSTVSA